MRYPKLKYFDGSSTRHHRVNSFSNFFLTKSIKDPYVMVEGEMFRQKIPNSVVKAMEVVMKKRRKEFE
jgi:hypothetical protein